VLLVAAMASYAASMVSVLGFARVPDPQLQSLVAGAALLFGHWLMLASLVSYARFVVLDAQGLITVRRRTTAKRVEKTASAKPSSAAGSVAAASTALSPAGIPRRVPQLAKTPADSSRWVDGSRPERDRYDRDQDDDTSHQKLSKSDRKRLRKLKAQGRAA